MRISRLNLKLVSAMFNLIFSQIYPSGDKLISTAFNQTLPKLYAFSMMWTLNARRSIRAAAQTYTSDVTRARRLVSIVIYTNVYLLIPIQHNNNASETSSHLTDVSFKVKFLMIRWGH